MKMYEIDFLVRGHSKNLSQSIILMLFTYESFSIMIGFGEK